MIGYDFEHVQRAPVSKHTCLECSLYIPAPTGGAICANTGKLINNAETICKDFSRK